MDQLTRTNIRLTNKIFFIDNIDPVLEQEGFDLFMIEQSVGVQVLQLFYEVLTSAVLEDIRKPFNLKIDDVIQMSYFYLDNNNVKTIKKIIEDNSFGGKKEDIINFIIILTLNDMLNILMLKEIYEVSKNYRLRIFSRLIGNDNFSDLDFDEKNINPAN